MEPLESSYWQKDETEPVEEMTVGGVLRQAVATAPDGLAIIEGGPDPAARRRWTYRELLDEAERRCGP